MRSSGFDTYHFFLYLRKGFWDYDSSTIISLVENLIDWINQNSDASIVNALDDILPIVQRGEILMFCPNEWLNEEDLRRKENALSIHKCFYEEIMSY